MHLAWPMAGAYLTQMEGERLERRWREREEFDPSRLPRYHLLFLYPTLFHTND